MEEKKLYNAVRKIITLADGRQIEIETGKLAKQADGSVVVKMGDTMLLGTVVAAKDAKPDTDFMPLQVEYKEKYAAVEREIMRLTHTGVAGSDALNALLTARGTAPVADGARLIDLLRRPQVSYDVKNPGSYE